MARVKEVEQYVERVQEMLDRTYDGKETTQNDTTPIRDLLTDIVHYTRAKGFDLGRLVERATEEADWEEGEAEEEEDTQ